MFPGVRLLVLRLVLSWNKPARTRRARIFGLELPGGEIVIESKILQLARRLELEPLPIELNGSMAPFCVVTRLECQ